MKVHEINVSRSNGGFVLSAQKRLPLTGTTVVVEGATLTEWYRPESVEYYFDNPEDVVTTIGRLLRDEAE